MNLNLLLANFDRLIDSPEAIPKMRELILDLAVRGKLVPQDPGEEPAIKSLRKTKRSLKPPTFLNSQAPAGWATVPLGCVIASNTGGGTPSKQNPRFWNGGIPWASVKDVKAAKYLTNTIDCITEEGLKNSSSNLIPPNRLLVVTRMGLGKLTINKIPVAINQDLRAIEINEAIELDYAYILFKTLKFVGKGVTVKGITVGTLHDMPIPLPPLAEQRRIVARVDELMAQCDRIEALLNQRETRQADLARAAITRFTADPTPANLEYLFHDSFDISPADLRKVILTLAVQGKLVKHSGPIRFGKLEETLADGSYNGISKGPTSDQNETEILRISAGTSRSDFNVDEDDFKHVAISPDEIEKARLLPGDLLACRYNGNLHFVGRFSYYRGISNRTQVNPDKLIRFRIDTSKHDPRYICLAMNAPSTRMQIECLCATTAGNIGLSAGKMRSITIPLPKKEIQQQVVMRIINLFSNIDFLEENSAGPAARPIPFNFNV